MPDSISCVPADLISEAACIDSCIPRGMQTAILISIFCRMAEISCDSADLIEGAKCISECIPPGMQQAVLIYVMCQFVNGGGGGGGVQQVFPGNYGGVEPAFTPPAPYAVAKDLDAPFVTWFWNPDTNAWE